MLIRDARPDDLQALLTLLQESAIRERRENLRLGFRASHLGFKLYLRGDQP